MSLGELISRCSFCGFCETSCPTYLETLDRLFSPRGRVAVAKVLVEEGLYNRSSEKAIYTCLLCHACEPVCPSDVPVVEIMLRVRRLIAGNEVKISE